MFGACCASVVRVGDDLNMTECILGDWGWLSCCMPWARGVTVAYGQWEDVLGRFRGIIFFRFVLNSRWWLQQSALDHFVSSKGSLS
jgi:hypothetical protein